MLLYIDWASVRDDVPKEEYVHRMNCGIRDALEAGIPRVYVEEFVREFIPEEGKSKAADYLQAKAFDDSRE